jgi:hypothetical protein
LIENYGEQINIVRYHVWWPSSGDPFWNFNQAESRVRNNYYGNNYTPHAWLDGLIDGEYYYSDWEGLYTNRVEVSSPIEFFISGNFDYDTREVDMTIYVTATDVIEFEHLRFFCILVENELVYGSSTYSQVMRDMVYNGVGSFFEISEGETVTFDRVFTVDEAVDENKSWIIIFVQDGANKEVLQSQRVELTGMTGIDEFPQGYIPSVVSLLQNYPNPFNASTNITFDLRENADVNLSVYNIAGQKVAEIANGKYETGSHTVNWDASGEASGVYFYKLDANGEVKTNRMILMK